MYEKETLADTVSYMKDLERMSSAALITESGLSRLNREGSLKNPHKELVKVLYLAREAYTETVGAFDVTVLPVLLHFETQEGAHAEGAGEVQKRSSVSTRSILTPETSR